MQQRLLDVGQHVLHDFCQTNTGTAVPGAFGRLGVPNRRADPHQSARSVVLRVSAAHQALTALE